MSKSRKMKKIVALIVTGAFLVISGVASAEKSSPQCKKERSQWMSGDFHQHTLYTDGSTDFDFVMGKNNEYGLDWWANSEHGGGINRDGLGHYWDDSTYYPTNPIKGDVANSGGHQVMWRWQSLRDFVFADILDARSFYPDKRILSGLEWNVPSHEHCSTGIVARDASAISAFEYQFDKNDNDTSRNGEATPYGTLEKTNGYIYTLVNGVKTVTGKPYPERHLDSVAACSWMQKQYDNRLIDNGWIVFAHIERAGSWNATSGGGYNVEHFRDFNNAGPDVCFGFEGAPGHQVNPFRGFGNTVTCTDNVCISKDFGGTYGGVGFYSAKVGGLWDALLGEGRRWFNFANSDYHSHWTAGGDDFYPGEYQKQWVYADDAERHGWFSKEPRRSMNTIANALRSGKSWFAMGDLIDSLEFKAESGRKEASMGDKLKEKKKIKDLKLTIKFSSPAANNYGDKPVVDHIDLIAGPITGKIDPSSQDYTKPTNDGTMVIASFTSADWKKDRDGNNVIVYHVKDLDTSTYFRLRGTNLACGTANETGPVTTLPSQDYCSPLPDALMGENNADKAFADLWFYSNPIFVYVK